MYSLISGNKNVIKALQQFPLYCDDITSKDDFASYSNIVKESSLEFDFPVKCSPYNIHVNNYNKHIVYNSLSNALYCFENDKEYNDMCDCRITSLDSKKQYIEDGLWVNSSVDVINYYLKFIEKSHRYWQHNVSIVLTTTLECNARCFYCYEHGVRHGSFKLEQIDDLITFISNLDLSKGIQIIWFGGEPLLNTEFIDAVSFRLKQKHIDFVSYLVTNGSLLDEEIIDKKFNQWNIVDMQVTIDGTEDEYKRIKNYSDGAINHYGHVLEIIRTAAEKGVNVNVRLNFSQDNKNDLYELLKELEARYSKIDKITFYPAFLTGISNYIPESERVDIVKEMLRIIKNPSKISFLNKFYSLPKISPCHRFSDRAYAIDVNGDIYACEHNVGRKEKAIGNISTGLFSEDTRYDMPPIRHECIECKFLPKCCGGCDSNYQNGDIACMIEKYMIQGYLEYLLEETM